MRDHGHYVVNDGGKFLVFPVAKADPTSVAQRLVRALVSVAVAVHFGRPICLVRFWRSVVLWATVPVTTIDKYRDADASKDKVGRQSYLRKRASGHSITQTAAVKFPPYCKFGARVARTI